jgi:hypothetical protein
MIVITLILYFRLLPTAQLIVSIILLAWSLLSNTSAHSSVSSSNCVCNKEEIYQEEKNTASACDSKSAITFFSPQEVKYI